MATRCYVGNLPYDATEADIHAFFGSFTVTRVKIITDRETNRPRGFAFVDFDSADTTAKAIEELDGAALRDRSIIVREAHDKNDRDRRPASESGTGKHDIWK